MKEKLDFKRVNENNDLVSKSTYNCLNSIFSSEELDNVMVALIDSKYMDGVGLREHYDIGSKVGVNCLICECKRSTNIKYVALLVPTGYRYNMSNVVRKYTNSRSVSVAPLEFVLEKTNMEYGSINPIGLPNDWDIYIDPKVLETEIIICGSGLQKSKLCLPSKYLLKLNNTYILENLAKE